MPASAECSGPGDCATGFHIEPTGLFPGCVDEYGAFDINGNVWEVVASDRDYRGYEVRGGAFNGSYGWPSIWVRLVRWWWVRRAAYRCQWPGVRQEPAWARTHPGSPGQDEAARRSSSCAN